MCVAAGWQLKSMWNALCVMDHGGIMESWMMRIGITTSWDKFTPCKARQSTTFSCQGSQQHMHIHMWLIHCFDLYQFLGHQDSKNGIFPMPVDDTISEGMPDLARPNSLLFSFLRSAGLCFRSLVMIQKWLFRDSLIHVLPRDSSLMYLYCHVEVLNLTNQRISTHTKLKLTAFIQQRNLLLGFLFWVFPCQPMQSPVPFLRSAKWCEWNTVKCLSVKSFKQRSISTALTARAILGRRLDLTIPSGSGAAQTSTVNCFLNSCEATFVRFALFL